MGFPDDVTLRADLPVVNAADHPQAPYQREPGCNGGRADMGAYGNTWRAPQQPPLDQMAVTLTADTPIRSGRPGETISYTLTLQNSGSVSDTYGLTEQETPAGFTLSFAPDYELPYRFIDLAPSDQISITVWVQIPLTSTLNLSNTMIIKAIGRYDIQTQAQLTALVSVFQEQAGQVVMEAEHFAAHVERGGRSWLTQTVLSDYNGESYVSAWPDTDLQFTSAYTMTSPELDYTINFTTTGVYYVWLRSYAPNAAGDSVYIGLDGISAQVLTGFNPQMWDWANTDTQSNPVTIEISQPGRHTLNLWQREDGVRLDRILITTDSQYTPTGDGPPESQTSSNP